jgi:hypothetical protein
MMPSDQRQIIDFARKYQCSEANAARILFDFGITLRRRA